MTEALRFSIVTPHGTVVDDAAVSVRVPAESGQVGLRPRQEPLALVVEPGLVLWRGAGALHFAATAGGLLDGDRERALLYTPFAVVGSDAEVLPALDRVLATPDSELSARRRVGELEQRIVQELRHRPEVGGAGRRHGWTP